MAGVCEKDYSPLSQSSSDSVPSEGDDSEAGRSFLGSEGQEARREVNRRALSGRFLVAGVNALVFLLSLLMFVASVRHDKHHPFNEKLRQANAFSECHRPDSGLTATGAQ
jgi:hypothetical protein